MYMAQGKRKTRVSAAAAYNKYYTMTDWRTNPINNFSYIHCVNNA
jgi:hypothetical protein